MQNAIDKLIFLDMDHVLTNMDVDGTSFLSYDPSRYMLSDFNLKNLDMILDAVDARIVIASNWRKFKMPNIYWQFNGKSYRSVLEPFKELYAGKIIDSLPYERGLNKCECLELWFKDNPWFSKHGHYVILEDDPYERYQEHPVYNRHLVMTSKKTGLTEDDARKAISILNS